MDQRPVIVRVRGVTSAQSGHGGTAVAVHVRVRDGDLLRERVEAVGSYADVAFRAEMSAARLSQILSGAAPRIRLENAVLLEKALGVPAGTYFLLDNPDTEVVAAYLQVAVPEPAKPVEPVEEWAVPVECGEDCHDAAFA